MAEASETPTENIKNNLDFITTIRPTTKLGGRGTPRRKTRRPNNNSHLALVAARTLQNKLKSFRVRFQLNDQQKLCDATFLYEDGRAELLQQVDVHSTWPMTIHEIDSSETVTRTYHINDLDLISCQYLLGNIDDLQNEFYKQSVLLAPVTATSNYYNSLQQRQLYTYPSYYYTNYFAYQQNPYGLNYDNYSNDARQICDLANEQFVDEEQEEKEEQNPIVTKRKRKRRRHKHNRTKSEQLSSPITKDEEAMVDKPMEYLEDESVLATETKRKRRRVRKSKTMFPSPSITGQPLQPSTIDIEQSKTSSCLINEQVNEHIFLSSSLTPTQQIERHSTNTDLSKQQQQPMAMKDIMHAYLDTSDEHVTNVQNERTKELQSTNSSTRTTKDVDDNLTPTILSHIDSAVADNNKIEDKNKNIIVVGNNNATVNDIPINSSSSAIIFADFDNKTSKQSVSVEKQINIDEYYNQQQIKTSNQEQPSDYQSLSDHNQVNTLYIPSQTTNVRLTHRRRR